MYHELYLQTGTLLSGLVTCTMNFTYKLVPCWVAWSHVPWTILTNWYPAEWPSHLYHELCLQTGTLLSGLVTCTMNYTYKLVPCWVAWSNVPWTILTNWYPAEWPSHLYHELCLPALLWGLNFLEVKAGSNMGRKFPSCSLVVDEGTWLTEGNRWDR